MVKRIWVVLAALPGPTIASVVGVAASIGVILVNFAFVLAQFGLNPVFVVSVLASACLAVALPALAIWGITRGRLWGSVLVSINAAWSISLLLLDQDPTTVIGAVVSAIPALLMWSPASRAHVRAVKACEPVRRRGTDPLP